MRIRDQVKDKLNPTNIREHVEKGLKKLPPLKKLIRNFIIIILVLFLVGLLLIYIQNSFESPRDAAEKIKSLGIFGPIAVILLIILEVVVAPIPGVIISVASGYAFGPYLGTIFSYIGNIIGTAIAFFLARKFGRPLVERLTSKAKLDTYDCFFKQGGTALLFIVFLFPLFPTDIVSFITGLSDIKWKKFMIIAAIAYIPNMFILNYIGASLFESGSANSPLLLTLALVTIALGIGIYFYVRRKMKAQCSTSQEQ